MLTVLIPLVRAWSNRTKLGPNKWIVAGGLNPFSQGVVQQDKHLLFPPTPPNCLNPFSQGVVQQDAIVGEQTVFYAVLIPLVRAWSNRTQGGGAIEASPLRLNPFSQGVVQQD